MPDPLVFGVVVFGLFVSHMVCALLGFSIGGTMAITDRAHRDEGDPPKR